tara:strand:- start:970 stop:1158 length:189 start_codon:yes stop_codon:yes gene_type:complete
VETSEQLEDILHVVNLTAVMIRHVDYLFDSPAALGREATEATAATAAPSDVEAPPVGVRRST